MPPWLPQLSITFLPFSFKLAIELIFFILLLISSALISGSEVAFFSLTPQMIAELKKHNSKVNHLILKLLENPDKLLATILISNNFVNIGIVLLSTYINRNLIDFHGNQQLQFIYEVVIITFIILFFGEILPKVYATQYNRQFAKFMAIPLNVLQKIFSPISYLLVKSSFLVKNIKPAERLSLEDLSEAINLTSHSLNEEKEILQNVLEINTIEVREIMTSRVDVFMLECNEKFSEIKKKIAQRPFSRIPVYKERLDNIIGILYVKDLIAHINKEDFFWCPLVKKPYFIPENKKIDDLLQEFRSKKIHMAIVIDEYGGFSGIITLEDILEEIVGEIRDEFEKDEPYYVKLSHNTYIFDGKILLKDFYRITGLDEDIFEEVKGEAETLAGFILELKGEFPKEKEDIEFHNIVFIIEKMEKRRIAKIKVIINN